MRNIPDSIIEEIKTLIDIHKSWRKARKHCKTIFSLLGYEPTSKEIYDAVHNIRDVDRFAPCGVEKRFDGFWAGYRFCGTLKTCNCAVQNTKTKSEITNVERYGAKRPLQNSDIFERTKMTNIERYGSSSPLSNKIVREKIITTTVDRYGVENYTQTDEYKIKVQETNISRYGCSWGIVSKNSIDKKIETNRLRYGCDYASQADTVKNKIENTNIEKFGVKCSLQSDHTRVLMEERYGELRSNQIAIGHDIIKILKSRDLLSEAIEGNSFTFLADKWNVGISTILKYCREHGIVIPRSSYENAISTFLNNAGINYIHNTRSILGGAEIDFYLPEFNIAIEFNGLYWHSSIFKDKNYHKEKYNACNDKNIRLVMINEDEWINRGEIVRSKLLHLFGKSPKGAAARKLKLMEINSVTANDFFEKYHLQGRTGSITYAVGSYEGDKIVGAMAFNHQRGTNKVELIRFCSDQYSRSGLFSRMLKFSIKENHYTEILSFADLRYSMGEVYSRNGFRKVGIISPDYSYIIKKTTAHKSNFTKKKISKKFGIDMSTMTERQAMDELGFPRLYDCGKLKFVWTA